MATFTASAFAKKVLRISAEHGRGLDDLLDALLPLLPPLEKIDKRALNAENAEVAERKKRSRSSAGATQLKEKLARGSL